MVYVSSFCGIVASVYFDISLMWHKHNKPHTHMPIVYYTMVEEEGEEPVRCLPGKTIILEANKRHKITCPEPGTIYVNMSEKDITTEQG